MALVIQNRLRPSPSPESLLIDPSLLLRLCTVLYQHRLSPAPKLHSHLLRLPLPSDPPSLLSLLFHVCTRFPFSWRPSHSFHLFLLYRHPSFNLSPTTASKLLDVYGKSRNVELLWTHLLAMADRGLLSLSSLRIAARSLADAREISRCVLLFRLHPLFSTVAALNVVVHELCLRKHVEIARAVVSKLRTSIPANDQTCKLLIVGLCHTGDLIEAARVWNSMLEKGMEPEIDAYEEIIVTMFKTNRFGEAVRLFLSMRKRRFADLRISSYRIVVEWSSKIRRLSCAHMVFAEMLKRGIGSDAATVGHLMYGLLASRRVGEAYRVFRGAEAVDLSLCHGMMKGLLRIKRAAMATDILREMVRRGVEPNMHTYIMLLQGHMGKKGRKGRKNQWVNFDSVFVGGLVKAGKTLEASKFTERAMGSAVEVPRFDYNKFLHLFSNEDGVEMFEEVGRRLKEAGMTDLGDVLLVYGERMATRERRRRAMREAQQISNEGHAILKH